MKDILLALLLLLMVAIIPIVLGAGVMLWIMIRDEFRR